MNTDDNVSDLLGKLLEVATELSRFGRSACEQIELPGPLPRADRAAASPTAGLIGIARQLLEEGEVRRRYVPEVPDHCWPLILDLYIRAAEGRKVSVTDACIAARAPHTTALRWIADLVEQGTIKRMPDPGDKRRCFMSLASRTVGSVSRYLAHVAGIEALVGPGRQQEERRLPA